MTKMTNMRILLLLGFSCLALIALACSSGASTDASGGGEPSILRLAGGKAGDVVVVYDLSGTVTAPGAPITEAPFDPTTSTASVVLVEGKSYRVRIRMGGVEILETIITASQLASSKSATVDAGAVNAVTTWLTWRAVANEGEAAALAQLDETLAAKGYSYPGQMNYSAFVQNSNAATQFDLGASRALAVLSGIASLAADKGSLTQAQWNEVADAFVGFSQLTSTTPMETRLAQARTLSKIIGANLSAAAPLKAESLGSLSDLFYGLSSAQQADFADLLSVGDSAGTVATLAMMGLASHEELVAEGKTQLTAEQPQLAAESFLAAAFLPTAEDETRMYAAASRLVSLPLRKSIKRSAVLDKLHFMPRFTNYDNIKIDETTLMDPDNFSELLTMDEFDTYMTDSWVREMEAALAQLDGIASTFRTTVAASYQGSGVLTDLGVDATDIKVIRSGLNLALAEVKTVLAIERDVPGYTDTGANAKKTAINAAGTIQVDGSATYTPKLMGYLTPSFTSVTLKGGWPEEALVTLQGRTDVPTFIAEYEDTFHEGFFGDVEFTTGDGSEVRGRFSLSFYGPNQTSPSFYWSVTPTTNGYDSIENAYFDGELTSGGLTLTTNTSATTETAVDDILSSAPTVGTVTNTQIASEARAHIATALDLASSALTDLSDDMTNGVDRSPYIVTNVTDNKRADGSTYSTGEIAAFKTFVESVSDAFLASATVNPTGIDSSLQVSVMDLSWFPGNPRDAITDSSGAIRTTADGTVELDSQSELTATWLSPAVSGAAHLFGLSNVTLDKDFDEFFNDILYAFLDGLPSPYFWLNDSNGSIYLSYEDFATVNVYWSDSSAMTTSNYLGMASFTKSNWPGSYSYMLTTTDIGLTTNGTYYLMANQSYRNWSSLPSTTQFLTVTWGTVANKPTPEIPEAPTITPSTMISMVCNLPSASGEATVTVSKASGSDVMVDFGDGSNPQTIPTPSNYGSVMHPYSSVPNTILIHSADELAGMTMLSVANSSISGQVDISMVSSLTQLYLENNQITSVVFSTSSQLSNIQLINNQLTQAAVDQMLVTLDNSGVINGTMDISGGTSALPSATGQAAQTNLAGKGWTINLNQQ